MTEAPPGGSRRARFDLTALLLASIGAAVLGATGSLISSMTGNSGYAGMGGGVGAVLGWLLAKSRPEHARGFSSLVGRRFYSGLATGSIAMSVVSLVAFFLTSNAIGLVASFLFGAVGAFYFILSKRMQR
jgi:hypothetical protein